MSDLGGDLGRIFLRQEYCQGDSPRKTPADISDAFDRYPVDISSAFESVIGSQGGQRFE